MAKEISGLGMGEVIDKLSIVNNKIWHLETALGSAEPIKAGKIAIEIRQNNKERQHWIREINKFTKTGFWNDKVDHVSQVALK